MPWCAVSFPRPEGRGFFARDGLPTPPTFTPAFLHAIIAPTAITSFVGLANETSADDRFYTRAAELAILRATLLDGAGNASQASADYERAHDLAQQHAPDIARDWIPRITSLDYNNYVGIIGVGRVQRGKIRPNQQVTPQTRPMQLRTSLKPMWTVPGNLRMQGDSGVILGQLLDEMKKKATPKFKEAAATLAGFGPLREDVLSATRSQGVELVEKADLADGAFDILDFELAPAAEKEKAPEPSEA